MSELPGLLVVDEKDPRLQNVRNLLERSGRKREIQQIFSTSLTEKSSEVIAVRSVDILTALEYLLIGERRTSLRNSGTGAMARTAGWFYMTPHYGHSWFDSHADLKGEEPVFSNLVFDNISLYAEDIAFQVAFMQNIVPLLKDDWAQQVRSLVVEIDSNAQDTEYPLNQAIEVFLETLKRQISYADEYEMDASQILAGGENVWLVKELFTLCKPDVVFEEIINFLLKVVRERGGVCIGFNANILQGSIMTDQSIDSTEVIHSSPELAVSPSTGVINFNGTIVGIESLGDYEDQILRELGILEVV